MAIPISDLQQAVTVHDSDLFLVQQAGIAKKVNGSTLKQAVADLLDGHMSIHGIQKISTYGNVDVYRITYTDGNHFDFTVTNGSGEGGATVHIDTTLEISGAAADAKATGDAIKKIQSVGDVKAAGDNNFTGANTFQGSVTIMSSLYDKNSSLGTDGQVLVSRGGLGVEWVTIQSAEGVSV